MLKLSLKQPSRLATTPPPPPSLPKINVIRYKKNSVAPSGSHTKIFLVCRTPAFYFGDCAFLKKWCHITNQLIVYICLPNSSHTRFEHLWHLPVSSNVMDGLNVAQTPGVSVSFFIWPLLYARLCCLFPSDVGVVCQSCRCLCLSCPDVLWSILWHLAPSQVPSSFAPQTHKHYPQLTEISWDSVTSCRFSLR